MEYGLDAHLRHVPARGDRGEVQGWYGVLRFPGGGTYFEWWDVESINEHRDKFASTRNKDGRVVGPWVDHYEAMARKTVVRSLAKFAPLSPEVARAVAHDERPAQLAVDSDDIVIDVVPEPELEAGESSGEGEPDPGDTAAAPSPAPSPDVEG